MKEEPELGLKTCEPEKKESIRSSRSRRSPRCRLLPHPQTTSDNPASELEACRCRIIALLHLCSQECVSTQSSTESSPSDAREQQPPRLVAPTAGPQPRTRGIDGRGRTGTRRGETSGDARGALETSCSPVTPPGARCLDVAACDVDESGTVGAGSRSSGSWNVILMTFSVMCGPAPESVRKYGRVSEGGLDGPCQLETHLCAAQNWLDTIHKASDVCLYLSVHSEVLTCPGNSERRPSPELRERRWRLASSVEVERESGKARGTGGARCG